MFAVRELESRVTIDPWSVFYRMPKCKPQYRVHFLATAWGYIETQYRVDFLATVWGYIETKYRVDFLATVWGYIETQYRVDFLATVWGFKKSNVLNVLQTSICRGLSLTVSLSELLLKKRVLLKLFQIGPVLVKYVVMSRAGLSWGWGRGCWGCNVSVHPFIVQD